jgi:hypothetical protein
MATGKPSPEAQLRGFIDKFGLENQRLIRAVPCAPASRPRRRPAARGARS